MRWKTKVVPIVSQPQAGCCIRSETKGNTFKTKLSVKRCRKAGKEIEVVRKLCIENRLRSNLFYESLSAFGRRQDDRYGMPLQPVAGSVLLAIAWIARTVQSLPRCSTSREGRDSFWSSQIFDLTGNMGEEIERGEHEITCTRKVRRGWFSMRMMRSETPGFRSPSFHSHEIMSFDQSRLRTRWSLSWSIPWSTLGKE
jgi:hypothetical protein